MTAFHGCGRILALSAVALLLSGCFFEERKDELPSGGSGGGARTNNPPTISGTPPGSLIVGQAYDFQPSASDPDGDSLTFSIQNRPTWATFNDSNGRLTGTPDAGDVGEFSAVQITVSDGSAQASLNQFTISVNQVAIGSVTLSWLPPTTNADGSAITGLAGYRIYYGTSASALDEIVVIGNAGLTRWVVENLSPATWYFSMTSYNAAGIESSRSAVVSRNLT